MTVMMKCGHAASGTDSDGNPVCVSCYGIDPGAKIIDTDPPNLAGRMARCAYYGQQYERRRCECDTCRKQPDGRCHCERPSSPDLAFFGAHPEQDFDKFYCGCHSWD